MTSNANAALRGLLRSLADVYAAEGRPGGDLVAAAYARGAETMSKQPEHPPYRLNDDILAASAGAMHPAAIAAREAHPVLHWSATGILDQQLPNEISDMFAVVVLVGPGAVVEAEDVRAGLFVQRAGRYYPLHAHNAEETYVMLAGEGEWTCEQAVSHRVAGDYIFHPSNAAHATRTFAAPLMAAWRWSGDIELESYRMLEAGE